MWPLLHKGFVHCRVAILSSDQEVGPIDADDLGGRCQILPSIGTQSLNFNLVMCKMVRIRGREEKA